ncbi:MAG TPA: hypothetical protein VFR97_06365 [Capillimicrobium sp.]|nr:hypothetical protein [Capillimicrobium sp.]
MRLRAGAAVVAATVLACGTVAVAQSTQVNQYDVTGDVTPNKVGTKAKPLPVGLKVGWTMSAANGARPATVERYTINVYGGRENTELFPSCPAVEINNALSDDGCPKASKFGSGFLEAKIGQTSNPSDMSIQCRIPVVLYNGGKRRASIYLETAPPACPVPINQAIDARFVDAFGGKGRGLRFSVPDNLMHPIPGLSVAVTHVETTLPRKTTRVKGRLRGFLESTEPCVKGERYLEVEFVTEGGDKQSDRFTKAC